MCGVYSLSFSFFSLFFLIFFLQYYDEDAMHYRCDASMNIYQQPLCNSTTIQYATVPLPSCNLFEFYIFNRIYHSGDHTCIPSNPLEISEEAKNAISQNMNLAPCELQHLILEKAIREMLVGFQKFSSLAGIALSVVDLVQLTNTKAKVCVLLFLYIKHIFNIILSIILIPQQFKREELKNNAEIATPWAVVEKIKTAIDTVSHNNSQSSLAILIILLSCSPAFFLNLNFFLISF